MLKKELILRNPLRQLGFETEDILPAGDSAPYSPMPASGKPPCSSNWP